MSDSAAQVKKLSKPIRLTDCSGCTKYYSAQVVARIFFFFNFSMNFYKRHSKVNDVSKLHNFTGLFWGANTF